MLTSPFRSYLLHTFLIFTFLLIIPIFDCHLNCPHTSPPPTPSRSVILGITQMIFGVCLKGINALYFRSYLDFFCEFLPMIIFAVGFFGYMIILIFIKWSINWDDRMALGSCNYNADGVFGGCNLGM